MYFFLSLAIFATSKTEAKHFNSNSKEDLKITNPHSSYSVSFPIYFQTTIKSMLEDSMLTENTMKEFSLYLFRQVVAHNLCFLNPKLSQNISLVFKYNPTPQMWKNIYSASYKTPPFFVALHFFVWSGILVLQFSFSAPIFSHDLLQHFPGHHLLMPAKTGIFTFHK